MVWMIQVDGMIVDARWLRVAMGADPVRARARHPRRPHQAFGDAAMSTADELARVLDIILVDRYGEDEEYTAFLTVLDEEMGLPIAASLLGTPVTATELVYHDPACGLVARCDGSHGSGDVNHRASAAASAVTHRGAYAPSGMTRRLGQFGNREQHGCVLQGMQRVPRLGNDQQVTVAPFPLHGISNQPHPTMQHVHGRLAGILVFRHRRPGGQRHQRLPQHMLVPAIDGPCGPAGRSSGCRLHQLTSKRIKRQLLHTPNVITQSRNRQRHRRTL